MPTPKDQFGPGNESPQPSVRQRGKVSQVMSESSQTIARSRDKQTVERSGVPDHTAGPGGGNRHAG